MSTSTDGQLSYGVVFDEDYEFPWNSEEFDGDIEEWWRSVNNYHNPCYYPFTEDNVLKEDAPVTVGQHGDIRVDWNDPRIIEYYKHQRDWLKANPVPVMEVNYCSSEYPMFLLAVKHVACSWGYPQEINPSFLEVTEEERNKLLDFLNRFGIEADEPKWWLTSYWG